MGTATSLLPGVGATVHMNICIIEHMHHCPAWVVYNCIRHTRVDGSVFLLVLWVSECLGRFSLFEYTP